MEKTTNNRICDVLGAWFGICLGTGFIDRNIAGHKFGRDGQLGQQWHPHAGRREPNHHFGRRQRRQNRCGKSESRSHRQGYLQRLLIFVNFLAGQADVGGGSFPDVPLRNVGAFPQVRAMLRDLAPFLRGVVFVGKPALCERFDFDSVGLRGRPLPEARRR